jgi:hypothetical protein
LLYFRGEKLRRAKGSWKKKEKDRLMDMEARSTHKEREKREKDV